MSHTMVLAEGQIFGHSSGIPFISAAHFDSAWRVAVDISRNKKLGLVAHNGKPIDGDMPPPRSFRLTPRHPDPLFPTLKTLLEAWGFKVHANMFGILHLTYLGPEGNLRHLMHTIAPYVTPTSEITIIHPNTPPQYWLFLDNRVHVLPRSLRQ